MRRSAGNPRRGRIGLLGIAVVLALGSGAASAGASPGPGRQQLDIHVATWGDDTSPGTRGRPFKTLQRAQAAVRANTARMRHDIVVNLHPGTHRLAAPLTLSDAAGDSGNNGHRVIYQAYRYGTRKQATAVISGGREIGGWRHDDAARNVWRADVGDLETRQLFVDGERATRAGIDANLPALTRTPTGYETADVAPREWSDPGDIEFVFTGAFTWAEPRCGVDSIVATATGSTITMDQPCFSRASDLVTNGALKGRLLPAAIENSKSFLTQPGTFYLDRSRPGAHVLYYIPRAGEDLRRASVVAPVLESLVSGAGTPAAPLHDVTFRGVTFADATWLQPSTKEGFVHYIGGLYENGDGPVVAVTLSDKAQSVPGNVNFRYSDRIVLERNRFERLGAQGLEIVGSHNVVRGNVLTDISSGGILIGDDRPETAGAVSRGNVVDNNWIHDIGVQYHGGTAIYGIRTTDLTLSHNQANDLPYTGIFLGQGHEQLNRANGPQDPVAPRNTGARIVDNHVFDAMQVLSDGGLIYTTFKQGTSYETGSVIRGNLLHDLRQNWLGIYSDWGSSWQSVSDNVIYGVPRSFGGCSIPALNAGIAHIRYARNFWIDTEPFWPCGPPVDDVTFDANTVLPRDTAAAACANDDACTRIAAHAGLTPAYRDLLSR